MHPQDALRQTHASQCSINTVSIITVVKLVILRFEVLQVYEEFLDKFGKLPFSTKNTDKYIIYSPKSLGSAPLPVYISSLHLEFSLFSLSRAFECLWIYLLLAKENLALSLGLTRDSTQIIPPPAAPWPFPPRRPRHDPPAVWGLDAFNESREAIQKRFLGSA